MKKPFVLLVLMLTFAKSVSAFDCEVDGICYNELSDSEVEVTANPEGYKGDVVIPTTITYNNRQYSVIGIGRRAFQNTAKMLVSENGNKPSSITIHEGIQYIGDYAFHNCRSLPTITFPNSVTTIGSNAFYNCTSLASVILGNNLDSIGNGAFSYCSTLVSVTIPDKVKYVGEYAFSQCVSLSSVTIGRDVTCIGNDAFLGCACLTNVNINCENVLSWFSGNSNITELSLGDNVKTIGNEAFKECYHLKSVILADGLTSIGNGAFEFCQELTSISIPRNVTFIGEEAFAGCTSLSIINVDNENPKYDSRGNCNAIIEKETNTLVLGCPSTVIPDDVVSIGKKAFYSCYGLFSIIIPCSVTTIGAEAFDGSILRGIYCLKEEVLSTVDDAFINPQLITLYVPEIAIDKYRETSPWNQFKEVLPLQKISAIIDGLWYDIDTDNKTAAVVRTQNQRYTDDITIPSTIHFYKLICDVTAIGDNAFGGNPISSVSIPNSVKTIGDYAFSGTNLSTLNIPQSVMSIGVRAFSNCKFNAIVVDESNTVYDSREDCNAIIKTETNELLFGSTNTVIPNTVTSIGEYAFSGCSELSSITLPNSITSIGECAFLECTELSSINLPNSITNIGKYAFQYCSKLTSIRIPGSVNSIGDNPFAGCSGLTSIIVENNAFYDSRENCNAIINSSTNTLISGCSNTIIPNSITSIGSGAFFDCSNLKSVDIPQKVTTIGNGAFDGCTSIEKLSIPNSVTSIGEWAFSSCSSLSSVTLSENLKTVSGHLFMGSSSLTSIDIPNNVDSIGYGAFQGCKGLATVIIGNKVKAIGQFAFGGSGVRDLTIGNNVKTIYSCAFDECFNLKQLVIPNSVSYLDGWSFAYCTSLTNVTLGEEIPSINGVFVNCDSILSITSLNPIPPSASWSLPNIDFSQATLSVPSGSKEAYQNASFWKNFTNIVEIDPSGVQTITLDKGINAPVYDLNGRKLKEPSKGINIIGGRKVLLK